ncbi:hypothetical protein CYMTET_45009 [Cymbomonas tetramitiformis]|uniref:Uncharacterized protein n=1 Tax=Cymbomonas tetramitiformis TaxID=36881 RepID=A0AAE0EYG7_9CHLO|nr:hypothetical protein CYMTET_45009 [Cymbomonas tetramitiformis]
MSSRLIPSFSGISRAPVLARSCLSSSSTVGQCLVEKTRSRPVRSHVSRSFPSQLGISPRWTSAWHEPLKLQNKRVWRTARKPQQVFASSEDKGAKGDMGDTAQVMMQKWEQFMRLPLGTQATLVGAGVLLLLLIPTIFTKVLLGFEELLLSAIFALEGALFGGIAVLGRYLLLMGVLVLFGSNMYWIWKDRMQR